MQKLKPVQQLLDARGRTLIERRNTRRSTLADDAYHLLRTVSWRRALLVFAAVFLGSNLLFAAVLYFGHAEAAISRDGLTLYYDVDGYGDVYASTRSSTSVMFDPGTVLFPGAGDPAYVTQDGCEVYIAGSDVRVARRPM